MVSIKQKDLLSAPNKRTKPESINPMYDDPNDLQWKVRCCLVAYFFISKGGILVIIY